MTNEEQKILDKWEKWLSDRFDVLIPKQAMRIGVKQHVHLALKGIQLELDTLPNDKENDTP